MVLIVGIRRADGTHREERVESADYPAARELAYAAVGDGEQLLWLNSIIADTWRPKE